MFSGLCSSSVCFRFLPEEQPWKCPFGAFRCSVIRPRLEECPSPCAMTPDPSPTVRQLLAFYLEAGVDCALTETPVNRLSDPDLIPAPSEIALAKPVRAAAPILAARAEAAPAPEAAIQSAREAARTAPTLEGLRALL